MKIQNLKKIVEIFGVISGLKVNMEKSIVVGINTSNVKKDRLDFDLGCSVGGWPLKYLGLPLGGNPMPRFFWNPIIEKIGKMLNGWKKAFISRGGEVG